VLQRDSFKCTACGKGPATDPGLKLNVDHKIPWSRAGPTTLDNLTTLCEYCNLGKAHN
jgi:5-methylcytosine-specific restriction protein A